MSLVKVTLLVVACGGAALINISDKTPIAPTTIREPMRMQNLLKTCRIVQRFITEAIAKDGCGYIV